MSEIDRRDFLKLVGAGAGAAAAAGCSDHVEKLIPYVVQPEEITPGIAVHYASTCTECPAGCGLHVRTREGRPVKLEGNPDHPVNRGALCARGQTGIGRTYHPDRFRGPMRRNASGELEPISWDEGVQLLAAEIRKAPGRTHVLGGEVGPTLSALVDRFVSAVGAGDRVTYEPFAPEALREAARNVFGVERTPSFDLSGSDLVIDFGSEALETGLSPTEHARQLAEARDIDAHPEGGARFVVVSPRLSMTASNADEWIPARPGTEGVLALALARATVEAGGGSPRHQTLLSSALAGADADAAAATCDVPADSIRRLGRALARARSAVALPPGVGVSSRRNVAAVSAVLLLNDVVGATGSRMSFLPDPPQARPSYRDTLTLVKAMEGGEVGVLLVHDSNPAYSLPRSAGFDAALSKVPFVVSFASMPDETTAKAQLVLPDHTPLESWGDASPRAGVRSLMQPTLRPLYDTRALGDTLLDVGRVLSAGAFPAGSFRQLLQESWGPGWTAALARGGEFEPATAEPVVLSEGVSRLEVIAPKLNGDGDFALVTPPHGFLYDGRGANLPWLQEVPDNVTKVAWTSWVEISSNRARERGLELGDVVTLATSAGSAEVPVYPRGGIRDDVVSLAIGQGHTVGHFAARAGDDGSSGQRGVSVLDLLPTGVDESGGRAWLTETVAVTSSGRSERLPMTQFSDDKRGRQLGDAVTLAAVMAGEPYGGGGHGSGHGEEHHGSTEGDPGHAAVQAGMLPAVGAAGAGHGEEHGGGHEVHEIREPYDPAYDADRDDPYHKAVPYRWGMSIDLDRCTGCSACVAACYVENNIPVVGEAETLRVRQMAWLRINRFIGDGTTDLVGGRTHPQENREELGETDVRFSPMMCQHCGAAPCEPVCPVIATYHNEEGMNGMIYNRCIGTRYCANNCPYKVRRFNYFDNQLTRWPEPMRLMLNPDVTVRGQGVMEKCTYCVQRIHVARQTAKDEGRNIRDGEVVTACQQSCPTRAITFGNWREKDAQLVKKTSDERRNYVALHALNARPGTQYLARVQRGKVEG